MHKVQLELCCWDEVPAGHVAHDVLPPDTAYLPAGHEPHEGEAAELKVPAAQEMQIPVETLKVPAGHALQLAELMLALEYPAGQSLQLPAAFPAGMYLPAGHVLQLPAPVGLYRPEGHWAQLIDPGFTLY